MLHKLLYLDNATGAGAACSGADAQSCYISLLQFMMSNRVGNQQSWTSALAISIQNSSAWHGNPTVVVKLNGIILGHVNKIHTLDHYKLIIYTFTFCQVLHTIRTRQWAKRFAIQRHVLKWGGSGFSLSFGHRHIKAGRSRIIHKVVHWLSTVRFIVTIDNSRTF